MSEEFKKLLKKLGPVGLLFIPFMIIVVVLFAVLAMFGVIGGNQAISPFEGNSGTTSTSSNLKTISIGESEKTLKVEIADTPEEWETGLMNRTSLAEDQGMLFVFPDEYPRSFWMKNTYIPLDIIFINSDGIIINFFESAEPLNEIKTYESSGGAKYALELNGGTIERLKIKVGEKINF